MVDAAPVPSSSTYALRLDEDTARVSWASFSSLSAGLAGLALAGPVGRAFDATFSQDLASKLQHGSQQGRC